jgi:hypothetical protein
MLFGEPVKKIVIKLTENSINIEWELEPRTCSGFII